MTERRNEELVDEAARLAPIEYEQRRQALAKELGLRVGTLDEMVKARRKRGKAADDIKEIEFEEFEPWPEPVETGALLEEIETLTARHCILPEGAATVMAAWTLQAWAHDAFQNSPLLVFTSPEKGCGKTTAMRVIDAVAPRALFTVSVTTAALFRIVNSQAPTLLIDEADTFLTRSDEMRGIINGGHTRANARVLRTVGDSYQVAEFNVWAPKCIGLIGELHETLADRALHIRLRPIQEGEICEEMNGEFKQDLLPLRRRAKRWAQDNLKRLMNISPKLSLGVGRQSRDNVRGIAAIAELAGGCWPVKIMKALAALRRENVDRMPVSPGIELLRDIKRLFQQRKAVKVGSTELTNALLALEESPWSEWKGHNLTPRGLSALLRQFNIRSRHEGTGSFYYRDAFDRAFADYADRIAAADSSSASVPSLLHLAS